MRLGMDVGHESGYKDVVGVLEGAYRGESSKIRALNDLVAGLPAAQNSKVVQEQSAALHEALSKLARGDSDPPGEAQLPEDPMKNREPPARSLPEVTVNRGSVFLFGIIVALSDVEIQPIE